MAAVDAKLLKQTKFPPEFSKRVDMTKVNVEVMKKWIAEKISIILGNEDDVVIELCFNLLEGTRYPNIKHLQIQLTGFLDKDTAKFCKDLWNLCLSAQSNPQGVPKELLEAKKLELIQEKLDAEKAAEEARRRKEEEQARDRELESVRQREREARGRGRRGRGPVPRDANRIPDSPRRHRSPDRYNDGPRRRADTYVPDGGRPRRQEARGRRPSRSPSSSVSRSRSRSARPPRYRRDERDRDGRGRRSSHKSRSPYRRDAPRRRIESPSRLEKDRSRSTSSHSSSRSYSPRRRRRSKSGAPRSTSPRSPSHDRRSRRRRPSKSRSRSPSRSRSHSSSNSRTRRHRGGRWRRSPSYTPRDSKGESRADISKGRVGDDDRRRGRTQERIRHRRRNSSSPISSPDRRRLSPSRSGSHARAGRNDRKRHQSIERYAPAGRTQHKSPSSSPPAQKRRKLADLEKEVTRSSPQPADVENTKDNDDRARLSAHDEHRGRSLSSRLTSTEFREKLLKEKVKAIRRSSTEKTSSKS